MTISREQICLKIIEACEKDGEVRAKLEDGTWLPLFKAGVIKAFEVVGHTICEAASMKFHRDCAFAVMEKTPE